MPTLEDKLIPLRKRYRDAGEIERKVILLAVKQLEKEYGKSKRKTSFEEHFKTAQEVFGII